MKSRRTLYVLVIFLVLRMNAQYHWTWVNGSNFPVSTYSTTGVFYGTQGVPSTTNQPGGRSRPLTWTDSNGNLWLFGGIGGGYLSDLWKYNPSTNEWTWVKGPNYANATAVYGTVNVGSPSNNPGGREGMCGWADASGNLWMFSGLGYGASSIAYLNELWKYNIASNQWTYVRGSINPYGNYGTMGAGSSTTSPGVRVNAVTGVDAAGDFWMFGGYGFSSNTQGLLNDLWKYNVASDVWTYVKGFTGCNIAGQYGTKGTSSSTTTPGSRQAPFGGMDAAGNFWVFGGYGYVIKPTNVYVGRLNDLWKFSSSTGNWTWMSGSDSINDKGVYGTKGLASSNNVPRNRTAWIGIKDIVDKNGNLWIMGGSVDSSGTVGEQNDLWKYDVVTGYWTWMKGSSSMSQAATYGTLGIGSPSNTPGARAGYCWWRDNIGKFWLLGGTYTADLWTFDICYLNNYPANLTSTTNLGFCSPGSVTLTAGSNTTVTWYATPTSTASLGSGSVLAVPNLSASATLSVYSYYAEATGSCGISYLRTAFDVTVFPNPTVAVASGSICSGQVYTLSPTGGLSYTYSSGSPTVSPTANSTYTVSGINSYSCASLPVTASITVYSLPTVAVNSGSICLGQNFTLQPTGALTYAYFNSSQVVSPTATSSYSVFGIDAQGCISALPGVATVSVAMLPTISVSNGAICAGNSFTLSPSGALSYSYSSGSPVVSPSVMTSYTVSGMDANGCEALWPAVATISINPSPTITVNSGTICAGDTFTLLPGGAVTYTYSSITNTVTPQASTSYSISGTGSNGCVSLFPAVSSVIVKSSPSVSITASPSNSICVGENLVLMAGGASTYSWSTTSPDSVIMVSPAITTDFTVVGILSNGCANSASISVYVSACVGLKKNEMQKEIAVYPNPTTGKLIVSVSTLTDMRLCDMQGRSLLRSALSPGDNEIDLQGLEPGIYSLTLIAPDRTGSYKIVLK